MLRNRRAGDRELRGDVSGRHFVVGDELEDRPALGLRDRPEDVVRGRRSAPLCPEPDGLAVGIGGPQPGETSGRTTIYMRVDDLQAYLDKAERLGGKTLVPPTPLPGDFGSFAMFADPDGQAVGLWA